MNECDLVRTLLAAYADGDLDAATTEQVDSHVARCSDCRVALAEFRETDGELAAWAQGLAWQNPARPDAGDSS